MKPTGTAVFCEDRSHLPRLTFNTEIRSTHALITREIAIRILNGTYPPDCILPNESLLIEEFGVSRSVLREALKTLAAKGMIVAKTKVGTKVLSEAFWNMYDPQVLSWHLEAGPSPRFLLKLFEVRQALEPAAAAMAALRRTPGNLRRMQMFLSGMECMKHNRETYAEWDLHFHQEVLIASGNPFMLSFTGIIESAIIRVVALRGNVDSDETLTAATSRHRAVLIAIVNRDPAAASSAMSQVISGGVRSVRLADATSPTKVSLPFQIDVPELS